MRVLSVATVIGLHTLNVSFIKKYKTDQLAASLLQGILFTLQTCHLLVVLHI